MVSQKEIIEALRFVATPYTESLANRIESEGIAPPSVDALIFDILNAFKPSDDGMVLYYGDAKEILDKYRGVK